MNAITQQISPATAEQRHGAFTLIELLIAVTIITLLMGMLLVGIGNVMTSSREAATRVTLKKVHEILRQQQAEFNLAVDKTPARRVLEPCLGIDADQNLKQLLERKRLFRENFPQRAADLFDINGNLTRMGQVVVNKYGINIIDPVEAAKIDSAELLYLILTEGSAYGTTVSDSDQFTANEIKDTDKDTDNDGLMEIVDGWGQPLRFYRWPTRMIRPCDPTNVTTAIGGNWDSIRGNLPAVNTTYWKLLSNANLDVSTLGRDPDDPTSSIYRLVGGATTTVQAVELNANNTCTFHTPDTYAPMLVVSMGADQELGLFEPEDTANFGHLAQPTMLPGDAPDSTLNDNLTNLQGVE